MATKLAPRGAETRRGSARSPSAAAIERLGKLAGAGTSPARMARATRDTVAAWRASADSDIALRWTAELHADAMAGLAAGEEQADDVDASEPGAAKHAAAVVSALRAMVEALAGEMRGM